MDITAGELESAICRLRQAQLETLTPLQQVGVVSALSAFAQRWRDPSYELRRQAELITDPFPFAMVEVSLNALLDSLTPERLWDLIDSEEMRGVSVSPVAGHVIGHVIAGNTPLLSWVSIIRALLAGSGSLVKLPSGPASVWGHLFYLSLLDVSPKLAECVAIFEWPGGTADLDSALCVSADLIMAHGSDATLRALQAYCTGGTSFIGDGHRVSFGLVTAGNGSAEAAAGFAQDILLYDQGGCLSPQTIFVEGDWSETIRFAAVLAEALALTVPRYPLPARAASAASAVREARLLASMEEGTRLWGDEALRWTVLARPQREFVPSPTFGIISVQPLETLADLPEAIALVSAFLQGCAVAGDEQDYIPNVSYLCAPGEMQTPPLHWRQDGRDVLRLLPGRRQHENFRL